jgi:hypothetical protein
MMCVIRMVKVSEVDILHAEVESCSRMHKYICRGNATGALEHIKRGPAPRAQGTGRLTNLVIANEGRGKRVRG